MKIKIIKSPYNSIKKGTMVKLLEIKKNHFMDVNSVGKVFYSDLYIVDLNNGYFREYEIEIYE